MRRFLLFRLYGPLAAWGDVAVGEQRPVTPHPSKSAVLGLVAAALGIRRQEEAKLRALAEGYGYAVRVDAGGVALRDYHTTQIPESVARLKHLHTRRDELLDRDNLYTVLSSRDYRADALYTVCLGEKANAKGGVPDSLEEMVSCLREPRLPLYLGRKSCPLALPLLPACIEAENFEQAMRRYDKEQTKAQRWCIDTVKAALGGAQTTPDFYWETGMTSSRPLHTTPRLDAPLSRLRWQFAKRDEHYRRGEAP